MFAVALLSACEETEIPDPESNPPTVEFLSPSPDSTFTSGEPTVLQVQFDDDEELHELLVTIVRIQDGSMVYQKNIHQHGNSYRWVDQITFTTDVLSEFELRAIATDHELQQTKSTVTVTVLPE